ncbi:MAG: cytochrome c-type biogenesis CcmF C-terminal domain-containing protein, partial [Achromobacter sp.]
AGPLALILVALIGVGPLLRWRRDAVKPVLRRVAPAAIVTAVMLIAVKLAAPHMHILPLSGLALAFGAGLASIAPLWRRNLLRTPLFTWGMVVAHLGVAVSLACIACDSSFTVEKLVAARLGETVQVGPYQVHFAGLAPTFGSNWQALEARLEIRRGAGDALILKPQARAYWAPPTETSESAIHTALDGQLYTVLGKPAGEGRWQLRLWWKPFVTLIWGGGVLVACGGALALLGRLRRGRRRPQEVWE